MSQPTPSAAEKPELGNHDCEYDSDSAPCNLCGVTASAAIRYFERHVRHSGQAVDKQEWTANKIADVIFDKPDFEPIRNHILTRKEFRYLSKEAINAALADEREKESLTLRQLRFDYQQSLKELAAERQKNQELQHEIDRLNAR